LAGSDDGPRHQLTTAAQIARDKFLTAELGLSG
jgi:hypothetical protein